MRLNRYLALGGIGSRRGVEQLIVDGDVSINGQVCTDLSYRVAPGDQVRVGRKLVEAKELVTIALHKPTGFVTTRDDEFGRPTVYDLLPGRLHHLRHVGRLDTESEGLLLLGNDGELARKLTAPSAGIGKEYLVTFDQAPTEDQLETFRKGVFLPEGKAWAHQVIRVSPRRVVMVLGQGLKRQIRMMASALGLRVRKLVRTRIGDLTLEQLGLPSGKWKVLDQAQIDQLMVSEPAGESRPSSGKGKAANRRPGEAKSRRGKTDRKPPARGDNPQRSAGESRHSNSGRSNRPGQRNRKAPGSSRRDRRR